MFLRFWWQQIGEIEQLRKREIGTDGARARQPPMSTQVGRRQREDQSGAWLKTANTNSSPATYVRPELWVGANALPPAGNNQNVDAAPERSGFVRVDRECECPDGHQVPDGLRREVVRIVDRVDQQDQHDRDPSPPGRVDQASGEEPQRDDPRKDQDHRAVGRVSPSRLSWPSMPCTPIN